MPGDASGDILVLNTGSSSIKCALFDGSSDENAPRRKLTGSIGGIGSSTSDLSIQIPGRPAERQQILAPDHNTAIACLIEWLREHQGLANCRAIGHRIVHGGPNHFDPQRIDQNLLDDLRAIIAFAPEHLPQAIAMIEVIVRQFPDVPQFACFDTAFHKDLPAVARVLPLPRKLRDLGVRRYGFHGLSYEFLLRELRRIGKPNEADGHVILAHLGNGASLAAVHHGKPVDTTMGMTPAGGLVMSSRTGDLDPGLVLFLERSQHFTPEQFHRMVNHESGLLGISQISSDMRQLMAASASDPRAAEAVEMFCYSALKWIGSFAAALGGLDTLVFSGGIGEHQAEVRHRICDQLGFVGILLDETRNVNNAAIISRDASPVTVRVIPTDEEITIFRAERKLV
ncbi:MAG TPA: acetate/propionate family kinase [Tepidisphaeraceae bacterium]|nr:acetate/propionate family kinase [Tepidisphaeraceae bacterium]